MKTNSGRRSFLKKSAAAALAVPLVKSLEEYALAASEAQPRPSTITAASKGSVPLGTIKGVKISRLICGGNLISGYAHSRDLIYVSQLLKAYFTEQKIMETWAVCEEHGINTMIFTPSDKQALAIYKKYRAQGGKIQCIAQLSPTKDTIAAAVNEAVDAGIVGAVLVGNRGDEWTRDGSIDKIGDFLQLVRAQKIIAGIAGHELRTIMAVEKAGLNPDLYMKTLHSTNYWSKRRPDQIKEVIDNYGIDNYWCMEPDKTIGFMQEIDRPWIAYKVLAAGAIPPRAGFQYAFENGADYCVVGMFDFQVAEDVLAANTVLKTTDTRSRPWMT